jgi:hypothetical protein
MVVVEREQRPRVRALEDDWDKQETALRGLKSEIPALKATLVIAADAWKAKDPTSFIKWEKQLANAFKCSSALSRVWQIAHWITKGVPRELRLAIYALAESYSDEALTKHHIKSLQQELGFDIAKVSQDEECKDDDCCVAHRWWAAYRERGDGSRTDYSFIGDHDEFDSQGINGFSNYVPKSERMAMLEHLTANFEARKAYFAQSAIFAGEEYQDPAGVRPMKSFIDSAMHALDQAQAMIGKPTSRVTYFDAIVDLRTTLLDYRHVFTGNEEAGTRAWAKYTELPDSDSEDGGEEDDDDADDSDSGSEFNFASESSYADWNHPRTCDCSDCIGDLTGLTDEQRDAFWAERAERFAREAAELAAHEREWMPRRLALLRSRPNPSELDASAIRDIAERLAELGVGDLP